MGLVMAALGLGFLGSVHCTLMCGPLVVAGCQRQGCVSARDTLGYVFGRLFGYAFCGALAGHVGQLGLARLPMVELQRTVLAFVAVGAFVHGLTLFLRANNHTDLVGIGSPSRYRRVSRWIVGMVPKRGLGLGLVTAVLPCGLLVSAWALAAASASSLRGAFIMVVFSVATLPGLAIPLMGRMFLAKLFRRVSVRWYAGGWCFLGLWLGLRPVVHMLWGHH